MSVTVQLNGVTYDIPEPGDTGWGQDLTDYFIAQASGLLQKAGGTFTLTAEVDFGNTYGLKSTYFKSRAASPATAGQVRLGNTEGVYWRNAANSANLGLTVDASDNLLFDGDALSFGAIDTLTGDVTASGPGSAVATIANGVVTNAKVSAAAAIAYSKLNLASSIVNADVAAAAAIAFSKLAALTSGNILVGNGSNQAASVAMSGEATIANTGAVTLSNSAVIGKVLTGFSAGAGTVSATDTILQAFQKLVGNLARTPTIQRFTSGSGTYTTPTNPAPLYLRVRMVGAGGGGSGSGSASVGSGGAGGDTTFSTHTAGGGAGAVGRVAGAGGSATVGVGGTTVVSAIGGGGAQGGVQNASNEVKSGGMGGSSYFGGAAAASEYTEAGNAGAANTGGGGSGGGSNNGAGRESGGGGGSGGYVEVLITSPSATYSYGVGAGGAAGTAGTGGNAGGAGGSGIVIVEEFYQ